MRKDFWAAVVILAAACLAGGWASSVDWQEVWLYDVKPFLTWDFKPPGKPVGEDLKVENGQKVYAGAVEDD